MEFLKVDSVEDAREKLLSSAKDWLTPSEALALKKASGRIAAEDVNATRDIPAFRRSMVDGYAVLAADTAAAGESIPVLLAVKGQVQVGTTASMTISHGECVEVPTGGMLPDGADSVVMAECAEPFDGTGVAVYSSVAGGENVVQIGEDAKAGAVLLHRGRRILPQDVGALAAAGVVILSAYVQPRLTIISTGDELVPPEKEPGPGQIRDINTHALTALAVKCGYSVTGAAVLPDDENALEHALRTAMKTSDIVTVSGGSSKGPKDMTKAVIERVSSPGVYTHGIAMKPGKPTILGFDNPSRTLLVGLPGHPVSAMMVFELLLGWLLREMTGCSQAPPIPARISCNVASSPGKLTCWPVTLLWTGSEYRADPVFGKSGLITTLTAADGYIHVDRGKEGLQSGQTVFVHQF
ncbi:MAG: molybdopterin molybdotransferase MoeA [Clostridia bacterium]|nr:molybdopterin molybdotransferase MoeA [Clostridia bacterium]